MHKNYLNKLEISTQQLRIPREYDRSDPEWTPFSDEGNDY